MERRGRGMSEKKTCGACAEQTTVQNIIQQYAYCKKYSAKLVNEKMESDADSERCAECLNGICDEGVI